MSSQNNVSLSPLSHMMSGATSFTSPEARIRIEISRSQSSIAGLRNAWIVERGIPDLLPFQTVLVKSVQDSIRLVQDSLDNNEYPRALSTSYQMMVDRASFVLASYLRTRLHKIQLHSRYFLQASEAVKLSDAERELAESFTALMEQHFGGSFLNTIPASYAKLEGQDMVSKPDFQDYIVFRAREHLGDYQLGNTYATIRKGTIMIGRYDHVQRLLREQKADVI